MEWKISVFLSPMAWMASERFSTMGLPENIHPIMISVNVARVSR